MTAFDPRAPGVYLEAAETVGPSPLLSAVTAFAGIAERGPLHRPQPISEWGEFLDVFGGFVPYGHLAQSVYGFFLNGGERCIVVRVADVGDYSDENLPGACPRRGLLATATNTIGVQDRNGAETIALTAIDEGSWGNELRYSFQPASKRFMPLAELAEGADALDEEIHVDDPYDIEPDMELRLQHPTDPLASRSLTTTSVDETTAIVSLAGPIGADLPAGSRVLGRGFKLVVSRGEQTEVFDNLSISRDNPRYFLEVVNGPSDLTDYVERQRQAHSIFVRLSHVMGPGDQPRFRPAGGAPSEPAPPVVFDALSGGGDGVRYAEAELPGVAAQTVATVVLNSAAENTELHGSAGNSLSIEVAAFETRTALPVPAVGGGAMDVLVVEEAAGFVVGDTVTVTHRDNPLLSEDRSIDSVDAGNALTLAAALTNSYPVGSTVGIGERVTLSVLREGQREPLERHYNLSGDPAHPRAIASILEADSTLLCAEPPGTAAVPVPETVALTQGADPGDIDARFYTGYETSGAHFEVATLGVPHSGPYGLAALEPIDEVNLIAVPDLSRAAPEGAAATDRTAELAAAQRQVLLHCAKLGDRFALLDPLPTQTPTEASSQALALAGEPSAKFGALYYPWLDLVYLETRHRMPPSGPVAGLIARSDESGGVNRAPANFPLLGIVDLENKVDQDTQDELNPIGVNCIRKMRDGAILVWAARTLSQDRQARYVNVRRVLLAVKKFLSRSLLWTVFEPAGPALWRRVEAVLTSFLQSLYANGLASGNRPAEAFYAKCDAETNPPEVADAGQVAAEIGLALVAPAEFIVLSVRRSADAVNVVEEDV